MMTLTDVNMLFLQIEKLRDELKKIRFVLPDELKNDPGNKPLIFADSLIHQAEQTLLDANKWLGYHVMHRATEPES